MPMKEQIDYLLTKIDDSKKEEFLAAIKNANSMESWIEIIKKFGLKLSDKEIAALNGGSRELSDDELDMASGGCGNHDDDCSRYFGPCGTF